MDYRHGAFFGLPAHDQARLDFAPEITGLPSPSTFVPLAVDHALPRGGRGPPIVPPKPEKCAGPCRSNWPEEGDGRRRHRRPPSPSRGPRALGQGVTTPTACATGLGRGQGYWGAPIRWCIATNCGRWVPEKKWKLARRIGAATSIFGTPRQPLDRHPTGATLPWPALRQAGESGETTRMDTFVDFRCVLRPLQPRPSATPNRDLAEASTG